MSTLFDDLPEGPPRADLPALTGSDAQLKWATEVRGKKIAECELWLRSRRSYVDYLKRTRGRTGWQQIDLEVQGEANALTRLKEETSAGFWLDNRELDAATLLANPDRRRATQRARQCAGTETQSQLKR